MARIDTLKFDIDGKEYTSNINVNKDGCFKIDLHWEVCKAIGIENGNMQSSKLSELRSDILGKYFDYLESQKTEEMFIQINYASSGWYNKHRNEKHRLHISGSYGDSALRFDFKIYIKVTNSTGTIQWFKARKDENEWIKNGTEYNVSGTVIPYSDQALETLEKAKIGIENISKILYNFISQDVLMIESSLINGNLLGS